MTDLHSILILVPHQDDEVIIAGQIIPSIVEEGLECCICFATNGDFREEDGAVRAKEALTVAEFLGVPPENVVFLGYPNYDEKRHLHDYPNEPMHSFGHDKAYGCLDGRLCWSARRAEGPRAIAGESAVADIADVVASFLPDVILCIDFDAHPDHRALSLFFDEAMERVLRARRSYAPLVLKSFAYATLWNGPRDYYEFAETARPSGFPEAWPFELENPNYLWDERVRLAPNPRTLTPGRRGNPVYEAFRRYPSQVAWPHYRSVCNADVVCWPRRTDNLLFGAEVSASSGDVRLLGGFRRFDVKSVCVPLEDIEFLPIGWTPEVTDVAPSLKIVFSEPVRPRLVRVWCSPGRIPCGVVRCTSDAGEIVDGGFGGGAGLSLELCGVATVTSLTLDFSGVESPFSIASIEVLECVDGAWKPLQDFERVLQRHGGVTPKPSRFAKLKTQLMKLRVAFYYRIECKFRKERHV